MTGTAVATRVASRVLNSPNLTETAILVRQSPGSRNEYGEWVPGETSETAIIVATVPLSGDERAVLPEGLRERDLRKFWTRMDVSAIVAGETEGDVIRFHGIDYRTVQVDDWGGFRQILAVRPEASTA